MTIRADIASHMPATLADLVRKTGASLTTIKRRIRAMRNAGTCHVSSYRAPRRFGKHSPVFSAGPGVDATPPAPLTNADYIRKHHQRRKARATQWFAALK